MNWLRASWIVVVLVVWIAKGADSCDRDRRWHRHDEVAATAVGESIELTTWQMIWRTTVACVAGAAPIALGVWWLRRRYRRLQSELPPLAVDAAPRGEQRSDRLGERGLGRALRAGLAQAARELGEPGKRAAALDDAALATIASTVRRSVHSGDVASAILRRGNEAVYVVALPAKHARPQVVQRYLGAPWPEHVQSIQRATGVPVLSLVVLCGPDAAEATLHVGFAPGPATTSPPSDPEALLDVRAARERGANRVRYVMTLSAIPTNGA
jgi:hypothetical protein